MQHSEHVIFRHLKKSIFRFIVVGCVGFAINALILTYLYKQLEWPLLISQLIAAEAAILSNFTLHNRWTFDDAKSDSIWKRLAEFHMSSWSGSLITTIVLVFMTETLNVEYLISLGVGGIIAMFWNYFWTRFFIWKPKKNIFEDD